VFEREKTDPQTDIEFDFFDESPTAEASPRETAPRRRRRLPTRPPTPPAGPGLYRLGLLIAGAIILAVVLILAVNSCRASQKESEYRDYMSDVTDVAAESEELGKQLNTRLNTPGIKLENLRGAVEGFRQQQEQLLSRAQELQPPGPLVEQQESLIEAMQFRVSGLAGLSQAFANVAGTRNPDEASGNLATVAGRLLASDVIYADLFQEGSDRVLEEQDVTDVPVPGSKFVQDPNLTSPNAWRFVVQRLTRTPASGGLHGNGIQGVRVVPSGQTLSAEEDNTVATSTDLGFQVLVENTGENQEVGVVVRLVIRQDPVIRRELTIDSINPGDTKTVTFSDIPDVSFSTRTTLLVTVEPVAGETNQGNNSAQYAVIFTLPS
jgi:CARDB